MSLSKIATDTTLQFIGGGIIGVATDSFFPSSAGNVDDSTVLQVGAEVIGQLMVDGFLTYNYFDWLLRKGYISSSADQTRGLSFILSFLASQPRLRSKVSNLLDYLQLRFNQTYFTSQATKNRYQPDIRTMQREGQMPMNETADMTTEIGPTVLPGDFTNLTDE